MAVVKDIQNTENNNTQSPGKQKWTAVRVLDIILNMNHPKFKDLGGYDSIGTISYTILSNNTPNEILWTNNTAKPLFSHLKYYPLINEIVLILSTNDKNIYSSDSKSTYYFPQVNIWNHPHHNALPSVSTLASEETARDYPETENGIVRREVKDEDTEMNPPLGKYFDENSFIKPLLPYEGDLIIEGRFGNSIRFGSTNIGENIPEENKTQWSQIGKTGDPITIIRNGQPEETDKRGWVPLTEDSNKDASIIYMTSNQQITEFTPASLNQQSFGANIESQIPWDQELSNINLPEKEVEPDIDPIVENTTPEEIPEDTQEETPISTTQPEPTGSQDTTQPESTESQNTNNEEEDELTPWDDLMENSPEEIEGYIVDEITEYNNISPFSDVSFENNTDGSSRVPGNMDLNQPVGRHFQLKHLIYSNTAEDQGFNNFPGVDPSIGSADEIIRNLEGVMVNCVDKFLDKWPNLKITSGYRATQLNTHIRGSATSEHRLGMAIDFQVPNVTTSTLFNWAINGGLTSWSQMIWEYPEKGTRGMNDGDSGNSWIHVSYNFGTLNIPSKFKRKTLASRKSHIHEGYPNITRRSNYKDGIDRAKEELTGL
tara:strand:+ start:52 stop:1854 length:1803 start_codon:yes stop_codon:yes gene_type:complete